MNKVSYFSGIRFDHYSYEQLLGNLMKRDPNTFVMVVTPNVDHVVRANRDRALLNLYNSADISINDSRVLRNISRLIGIDLGSTIPGSDLTKGIIERMQGSGEPITIIGTGVESIDFIRERYSLTNLHHYNPPMGFMNDKEEVQECVSFIIKNPSRFIFLAVGSPRQEILALKAKEAGATGIALCIGASLLFLSGEEKRAPMIIQKLSLEWLYRLIQSPRRLTKRYLFDFTAIVPLLIKNIGHKNKKTYNS